ncbi:insoluble matrix shell protein [Acrasis kona]|uniref:Insoluble matrix shell protein n=1 Tax=Acrasis kona TaxID=1008807 RepID=A0AAW2YYX3_9EUKA
MLSIFTWCISKEKDMNLCLILLVALFTTCYSITNRTLVTMQVFSSRSNPQWHLEGEERTNFLTIVKDLYKNYKNCDQKTYKLGYTGFRVVDSQNNKCLHVVNSKPAETFLLESYMRRNNGEEKLIEHIKDSIQSGIKTFHSPNPTFTPLVINPVRRVGPDNVTVYSPERWKGLEEGFNNCYNYASDVCTYHFSSPGLGSGKEFTVVSCEDVWPASIRDGLVPLSNKTSPPFRNQPKLGHYVSLVIWPETDFHWYRKDLGGFWSHKPGNIEVRDVDASGNKIADPDKADIKPYTEICGYYIAIPSKLKLN